MNLFKIFPKATFLKKLHEYEKKKFQIRLLISIPFIFSLFVFTVSIFYVTIFQKILTPPLPQVYDLTKASIKNYASKILYFLLGR